MPLVPMRLLLDHAAENDYGLAAFNVNNMEQIQAIMAAAEETDSPVIIQASRGASKYSQDAYLRHLMLAAAELHPNIPVAMHQDHGNSPETRARARSSNGFTSVMMDGSLTEDGKTPADLRVQRESDQGRWSTRPTSRVSCRGRAGLPRARSRPAAGEQEDGHGATETQARHDQLLTDPDEAERFVAETGVDALGGRHRHQPRRLQVHQEARPATCWPWTASRRFTSGCPTATW